VLSLSAVGKRYMIKQFKLNKRKHAAQTRRSEIKWT
jgi:hypothetical protein